MRGVITVPAFFSSFSLLFVLFTLPAHAQTATTTAGAMSAITRHLRWETLTQRQEAGNHAPKFLAEMRAAPRTS